MTTAERLLYAQRWKDSHNGGMVGELAEIAQVTSLISKRLLLMFINDWKPLMDFFLYEKGNDFETYMFDE